MLLPARRAFKVGGWVWGVFGLIAQCALPVIFMAVGIVTYVGAQTKQPPRQGKSQDTFLTEMQASITLVEVPPNLKAVCAHVARNANQTYEAFTLAVPINDDDKDNLHDVVFIEDKRKGLTYEVRGFDFPRPFTDLRWRGSNILVFDQLMQPRYAVRYAINVQQRKLISATPYWERTRVRQRKHK